MAAARSIYMDIANSVLAKGEYYSAGYYLFMAGVANPDQHIAQAAFEKKDYRTAAIYFEDAEILERSQECWKLYADEIALPIEEDHLVFASDFQQFRAAAKAYNKAKLPERAHAMRVLAVSAAHQSLDRSAVDYRGLAEVHGELGQDTEAQEALLNEAAQVHAGADSWDSVRYADDLYQKTGAAPEIIARKKAEVEAGKGNAFESANLFEKAGDKPAACDQYLQALDDVDRRKDKDYSFTVVQEGDKKIRRVDESYFKSQLAVLDGVQKCCL